MKLMASNCHNLYPIKFKKLKKKTKIFLQKHCNNSNKLEYKLKMDFKIQNFNLLKYFIKKLINLRWKLLFIIKIIINKIKK